ncbi:hypothetical protein M2283_005998 [Streptomyces pseudovenezuelae]|uniref:Secreted protein n=1 Tax=Streptomyces pseudovenezuelae TaxID=67350 RepID=A0ABT6LQR5_9ACTN|nr:hypothetical protein [Streptomyces pseudovenezuelae]
MPRSTWATFGAVAFTASWTRSVPPSLYLALQGAPAGSVADTVAQVVMIEVEPMSLPPTVRVTSFVERLSASNCGGAVPWGAVISAVVALEQLTSVSVALNEVATSDG